MRVSDRPGALCCYWSESNNNDDDDNNGGDVSRTRQKTRRRGSKAFSQALMQCGKDERTLDELYGCSQVEVGNGVYGERARERRLEMHSLLGCTRCTALHISQSTHSAQVIIIATTTIMRQRTFQRTGTCAL